MNFDERSQQVAGQSAMIMLGLTQTALGVVLLIRLYVLVQPDSELRDIQWVLLGWFAVSVLNAFSARGAAGLSGADESIRLRSSPPLQ